MDKCRSCLYFDIYMTVDVTRNDKLYLCLADVEQEDDGTRYIPEISEFDSSDCIYFKEK